MTVIHQEIPVDRSRRSRKSRKSMNAELLQHMVEAELAPAELAKALGVSLTELAHWISNPFNAKTLEGLARLADVRAQMLLSKFRANAAIHLIQIASPAPSGDGHGREPSELSRKACVDLLTTNLEVFQRRDGDEVLSCDSNSGPSAPSEAAILSALEELAKQEPGADL